jgi:mono/diheme cytochrome c family protein
MKKIALAFALTFTAATVQAAMLPGDAARGKTLHDQQCVACHTSSVYTRANRNVKTVEGLIGQVNTCKGQLSLKLSRDQVNDLVKYLDEAFYKFP